MFRKLSWALTALVVAGILAAAALASPWKVIGHASTSGSAVVVNGIHATRPHQVAVELAGKNVTKGYADVACTKGKVSKTTVTKYRGAGMHLLKLPFKGGTPGCQVDATAARSGKKGRLSLKVLIR